MAFADIRRELIPARIAIWAMLLSGLAVDGHSEWLARYALAWSLFLAASSSLLIAGRRFAVARFALPLVELAGTTLLVGLAGASSYLGTVYLVLAGGYLLIYPSRIATLLGLAAVGCYAGLIPLDPALFPYSGSSLGVLLVGLGLLFLVLLGSYLSTRLEAARNAAEAASAGRECEREEATRIAAAALDATNAFLHCDGLDELGSAAVAACRQVFRDHRFALLLADGGRFRCAGSSGVADEDVARLALAMTAHRGVGERLAEGDILWSTDAPRLRHRTEEFGGGFVIPIRSEGATVGVLGVIADPAMATPRLRQAGETMAGQIALAYDLMTARAALRSNAVALAGEAWRLETAVAERTRQLNAAVRDLQIANRAKSEFLANVSHELRTPLTAIVGFSDVLLDGIDGPLNVEQHDDVSAIDRAGHRLLELIDDLIDISRIEAGRAELRRERIDPCRLVEEAVEELRPQAGEKGLELTFACEGLPAEAWLDPVRVRQVVVNLVENAVKFTPRGSVKVKACVAPARPRSDEQAAASGDEGDGRVPPSLVVEVADTGTGIEAADMVRIFDKFQRAAGPDQPGTGLGLAIAREFARLHGGDVTAESTRGLGSRFVISLPLLDAGAASGAEPGPSAAGAAPVIAAEPPAELATEFASERAPAGAAR